MIAATKEEKQQQQEREWLQQFPQGVSTSFPWKSFIKKILIRNFLYWSILNIAFAILAVVVTSLLLQFSLFVPTVAFYAYMHWGAINNIWYLYGVTAVLSLVVMALPNLIALLINNMLSWLSAKVFPFCDPKKLSYFEQKFFLLMGYIGIVSIAGTLITTLTASILVASGAGALLLPVLSYLSLSTTSTLVIIKSSAVLGALLGLTVAGISLIYRFIYQNIIKPFCHNYLIPLYKGQQSSVLEDQRDYHHAFFSTKKEIKKCSLNIDESAEDNETDLGVSEADKALTEIEGGSSLEVQRLNKQDEFSLKNKGFSRILAENKSETDLGTEKFNEVVLNGEKPSVYYFFQEPTQMELTEIRQFPCKILYTDQNGNERAHHLTGPVSSLA